MPAESRCFDPKGRMRSIPLSDGQLAARAAAHQRARILRAAYDRRGRGIRASALVCDANAQALNHAARRQESIGNGDLSLPVSLTALPYAGDTQVDHLWQNLG